MKILILDTLYEAFLKAHYRAHPGLDHDPVERQHGSLVKTRFGTSDYYSSHLNKMGHDAAELFVNAKPQQLLWASSHSINVSKLAMGLSHRLFRLPFIGAWLASRPGLVDIALAQIIEAAPDVLYCQDLSFLPPAALSEIRSKVRLIVGQNASPLPPDDFVRGFDLIITSFPHAVQRLRDKGISAEYSRLAFDPIVLKELGPVEKDLGATFVGGISRHHGKALPTLEYLAQTTPIEFFGYGAKRLPPNSPIKRRHHGDVWGLDMYRALARSKVTLNRHINVAENNANNMRLYEATGVGAMLITDMKDNLHELFAIGKEVVAYSTPEEAAELIKFYLAHPTDADAIAKAGQQRTLREHTYEARMSELVPILERYLKMGRQ